MSVRLRRFKPVVDQIAPLLEELFPGLGDGASPKAVDGWADHRGNPRRCRADYPNGWRVDFRINAKGQLTSRLASLRLGTKFSGPRGSAAEQE